MAEVIEESNKKTPFVWTDKRKEVAKLFAEGKEFMAIVNLGYSLDMTSKVAKALKTGHDPLEVPVEAGVEGNDKEEKASKEKEGGKGAGDEVKGKQLVSVTGVKGSPIVFWVEQKKISLDPFELHKQYSYYTNIAARNGGITNSFSEVQTLAMQVLWVLLQDIPKDENMLKAIFYGVT